MLRNLRILVVPVVLASAACASSHVRLYDGPQRPPAEIAVVTLPEQLELASVNGVEVPAAKGMWSHGDKQLELAPGRYELLVYYREVWQATAESDVLRSDPELFAIDAQAGHRYRIDYEHPRRYDDARLLATDFHGWIDDQTSGTRTRSSDSGMRFKKGVASQLTGDTALEPDIRAGRGNSVQPVQPLPAGVVAPPAVAANVAPAVPAVAPPVAPVVAPATRDWVSLMQGWWQQASPEERRAFLRWVGEQKSP
jgi:uncharacterized protein YccT (UPF0319 family)